MFDALRHQLLGHGPLTGQIQSHEGDIYIARLLDENGGILETHKAPFHSLINAREWLQQHGVQRVQLQPSSTYFEMINSDR